MAARQIIRRIIQAEEIAKPVGPYNHAVIVDQTMYLSGTIGMNKEGVLVSGGIEAEAKQALENVKAVLKTGGCTFNNVVKTTVYLADMKDYGSFNTIYGTYFTSHQPARACFQVAALPKAARVEIEAVAVVGDIIDQ